MQRAKERTKSPAFLVNRISGVLRDGKEIPWDVWEPQYYVVELPNGKEKLFINPPFTSHVGAVRKEALLPLPMGWTAGEEVPFFVYDVFHCVEVGDPTAQYKLWWDGTYLPQP